MNKKMIAALLTLSLGVCSLTACQAGSDSKTPAASEAGGGSEAVSYTHLDVYKRQVHIQLAQPCKKHSRRFPVADDMVHIHKDNGSILILPKPKAH